MAENSLQDKFQITIPGAPEEDGEEWATDKSARRTRAVSDGYQSHSYAKGFQKEPEPVPPSAQCVVHAAATQGPPIWDDIRERTITENGGMPFRVAGSTDVTDVVNPWDIRRGFARHNMGMTDDEYTGQHVDFFYDAVHGEDDGGGPGYDGFLERGNYLDRL